MNRASRRRVLRGIGVGAVVGVAGCSGMGDEQAADGAGTEDASPRGERTETGNGAEGDSIGVTQSGGWPVPGRTPTNHLYTTDAVGPSTAPSQRWQWQVSKPDIYRNANVLPSAPAIQNGTAFFSVVGEFYGTKETTTADEFSSVAKLVAVDTTSGELAWKTDVTEKRLIPGQLGMPVVSDGEVLIRGPPETSLLAYDAETGTRRWADAEAPRVHIAMTASGRDLFYGTIDGSLVRYDLDARSVDWTVFGDEGLVTEFPAVTTETVYVADGPDVVALDRTTGTEQWRTTAGTPSEYSQAEHGPVSPPVVDGDTVYVAGSFDRYAMNDTAGVTALDRATGEVRWSVETYDRSSTTFTGMPAVVDGRVYISGQRTLFALDAADGTVDWTTQGSAYFHVGAGDLVYVERDHQLTGINMNTGTVASTIPIEFLNAYTPTPVVGDTLFVPTLTDGLHAYGR